MIKELLTCFRCMKINQRCTCLHIFYTFYIPIFFYLSPQFEKDYEIEEYLHARNTQETHRWPLRGKYLFLATQRSLADPGVDLRGAWTLSTSGGGGKSLKVLTAEVIFWKRIASEASETKEKQIARFRDKKSLAPAPPPSLDPLLKMVSFFFHVV